MLTIEQKENAKKVFDKVKQLEKKYESEENRGIKDIEGCYTDYYILSVWEEEQYNEETGEGWGTFEDFLIDFIEQNIMFE